MSVALLNGSPAGADDLRALALSNYGHFTSMQVRGRAVRGLDLHLARLRDATRELFGVELDEAFVLDCMRKALDAHGGDCSLRVTVFSRAFDYRDPSRAVGIDVLATTSPASNGAARPLRVKSVEFVRPLPQVKHVATFPLFHHRRQARLAGFDDALFVDAQGQLVEGSVWNLGLWDGQGVVWPQGPALRGTMEQLLQSGLEESGVPQQVRPVRLDEVAHFPAAFAVNATGLQPIAGVDGHDLAESPELMALLERSLATRPWQPI